MADDELASQRSVARLRLWARLVLVPVGLIGAALSFTSIYEAARPTFGPYLSIGFPFLVDFLILGASLQYIAGAKVGRPRAGWRLTAHAGVAGTLLLNALAASDPANLPWHITAPAVWSVLVEMAAREVLGQWRASHRLPADRIPLALWASAPIESGRTVLQMMRTGSGSAVESRRAVGVNAATRAVMRRALPRFSGGARRTLRRQLRAGSLDPLAVLRAVGWHPAQPSQVSRDQAVRAALVAVLLADSDSDSDSDSGAGAGAGARARAEPPPVAPDVPGSSGRAVADQLSVQGSAAAPIGAAVHHIELPIVLAAPEPVLNGAGRPGGVRAAGGPGVHELNGSALPVTRVNGSVRGRGGAGVAEAAAPAQAPVEAPATGQARRAATATTHRPEQPTLDLPTAPGRDASAQVAASAAAAEVAAEELRRVQAELEAAVDEREAIAARCAALTHQLERAPLAVLDLARQLAGGEISEAELDRRIARDHGVSERTARRWLSEALELVKATQSEFD